MDGVDLMDKVDGVDAMGVSRVEGQSGTYGTENTAARAGGGTHVNGGGSAAAATAAGRLEAGGTKAGGTTARWREVSGLRVENEKTLLGKERRGALRKLYKVVEEEIRAELKSAQEDEAFKEERTFLWEPIPAVCQRLEIAPTVLSRLLKELTGMSSWQLVDKIRAEGIKEKLRAELLEWVKWRFRAPGAWGGAELSFGDVLTEFWETLKAKRRAANFSYATRAIELGFANYTRFYRACLLCYKKTPSQLEDEVLREFADWFSLAQGLIDRLRAKEFRHQRDPRWDKYRAPYADEWAENLKTRPEWMARMRAELGMGEEAAKWAEG
ncbi:MAG TPA: hypothetical protein VKX17_16290 [Planctomycetota bacterium]|nr:hypothetical protein [Planctomycetota bacterium]